MHLDICVKVYHREKDVRDGSLGQTIGFQKGNGEFWRSLKKLIMVRIPLSKREVLHKLRHFFCEPPSLVFTRLGWLKELDSLFREPICDEARPSDIKSVTTPVLRGSPRSSGLRTISISTAVLGA